MNKTFNDVYRGLKLKECLHGDFLSHIGCEINAYVYRYDLTNHLLYIKVS